MRKILFVFVILFSANLFAKDYIDLPEEELARESVTPVFDENPSVKNRNIVTSERLDLNAFYGWAMTEPINNVSKLGLTLYYNTSEENAFGFMFAKNFAGVSSYANQLKDQYQLDFSRAPYPDSTMMFDWNRKFFYGKMSITKRTVFNLSLYSSLMAGMIKYVHKSYPGIAFGIGQKFYFTKSWALRMDLRIFMNTAPIPFLGDNKLKLGSAVPSYSDFSERMTTTSVIDVGVNYLF